MNEEMNLLQFNYAIFKKGFNKLIDIFFITFRLTRLKSNDC